MRLFGGLSFPLGGRARAGISRRGRPWLGARAGSGAGYVGVLSSPSRGPLSSLQDTQARPSLSFRVDERGRVFLGDAELDVEGLRKVVQQSDETKRRNR